MNKDQTSMNKWKLSDGKEYRNKTSKSTEINMNWSYEEAIWVPVRGRDSLTSKIAASLGCDDDREGWQSYQ